MDPDRNKALVTTIKREGQPFVDEPIYVDPKPVSYLRRAIAAAFGSEVPMRPVIIGYERVRLNWIKPKR